MKRILLILTALFTIAGLLDWLIYNKSKEVEELEDGEFTEDQEHLLEELEDEQL